MNLFKATILPVSFCTSLKDFGSSILANAFILSGLTSVPLVDTRHPSTFPLYTPKMHFSGFKLRFVVRRLAKVSARSVT
jgi:hypothetical protein